MNNIDPSYILETNSFSLNETNKLLEIFQKKKYSKKEKLLNFSVPVFYDDFEQFIEKDIITLNLMTFLANYFQTINNTQQFNKLKVQTQVYYNEKEANDINKFYKTENTKKISPKFLKENITIMICLINKDNRWNFGCVDTKLDMCYTNEIVTQDGKYKNQKDLLQSFRDILQDSYDLKIPKTKSLEEVDQFQSVKADCGLEILQLIMELFWGDFFTNKYFKESITWTLLKLMKVSNGQSDNQLNSNQPMKEQMLEDYVKYKKSPLIKQDTQINDTRCETDLDYDDLSDNFNENQCFL